MNSVAKRLGVFFDNQGVKVSKLEIEFGLSNGRISKAIDRDSEIKPEIIDKIVSKFPHLSKMWLETGEGDMYNKVGTEKPKSNIEEENRLLREELNEVRKELAAAQKEYIELLKKINKP